MLILWTFLAFWRARGSKGILNCKPSALSNGSDPSQTPSAMLYDENNYSSVFRLAQFSKSVSSIQPPLAAFPHNFPPNLFRQPFPPEEERWYEKGNEAHTVGLLVPTPLFLKGHFTSLGILFFLPQVRLRIFSQGFTKQYNRPQCLTLKENLQIDNWEAEGSPQLLRQWICVPPHHTGSKTASKRLYNETTVVFVLRIHHTKPCIWNPEWPFLSGPSPTWEGKYRQIAWHFPF